MMRMHGLDNDDDDGHDSHDDDGDGNASGPDRRLILK